MAALTFCMSDTCDTLRPHGLSETCWLSPSTATHRCVDYVVVFDEPDVLRVLEVLRPSIHAKGTDYTEQTVPERAKVLEYGGAVRIAGGEKNHSTRDVIGRILKRTR